MLARVFSSVSPLLAQMDEPLPMICFTCTVGIAGVLSFGLIEDRPGKGKVLDQLQDPSEEKLGMKY